MHQTVLNQPLSARAGTSPFLLRVPQALRSPRILSALLRAPLAVKLAGVSAFVVLMVTAVALALTGSAYRPQLVGLMALALAGSLLAGIALVHLALQPVRDIEDTARRIWEGDLMARVRESPLADEESRRVGHTLNLLLDRLVSDRQRMRRLAQEVIEAGDRERARIARELHDSTAQTLAAAKLHVTAALNAHPDPRCAEQLISIRDLTSTALEEVRTMSHTIHPRVLDDMGLPAALEALARTARLHEAVDVRVSSSGDASTLPVPIRSVLYRVAQEALGNAIRHARPGTIDLRLMVGARDAMLDVTDDGLGFDPAAARERHAGLGLHTMEERLALVDGHLTIDSATGHGTRVRAVVPFAANGAS